MVNHSNLILNNWVLLYSVKIDKLHYLNLEVNTGKTVNTKENINIRCRVNSSEEHT